ncbi:MAG: NUDIX domain-containing protein [Balneolaceae bacterium]|nr:NUDIX domain-containing protein [Balneolaceae bacterium]
MKPVTAAGGVLFREPESGSDPEVLLILRNGVWDLPKGKLEENESVEECAVREVSEEVGCSLPAIQTHITDTYHEYREGDSHFGKTTHWYAMTLSDKNEELSPEVKEGIKKLEWVPLMTAVERVGYENLEVLLREFKKWLYTRP